MFLYWNHLLSPKSNHKIILNKAACCTQGAINHQRCSWRITLIIENNNCFMRFAGEKVLHLCGLRNP